MRRISLVDAFLRSDEYRLLIERLRSLRGDFIKYRLGLHILPTSVVATIFTAPTLTRSTRFPRARLRW